MATVRKPPSFQGSSERKSLSGRPNCLLHSRNALLSWGLGVGRERRQECCRFMRIETVESLESIGLVRDLFLEYSKSLDVDLCFQGFAEELATLPGDYAGPTGRLLLVFEELQAAGCGALRRIDDEVCEMKRLYVRPAFRGKGAGRELIDALIRAAREVGYKRVRLDTLPSMTRAMEIYRSLGFREIAPYRVNPVPGASFLELDLTPGRRDQKQANFS
jgi:ribosomal protein S18 acetylase RimI-like enzyme